MYCVKCGVKLQEGTKACPLCNTPVWDPLGEFTGDKDATYSKVLPKHTNSSRIPEAALITVFFLLGIFAICVICFSLYGRLSWGGYAIGGMLLFYVAAILPMWFRYANPVVFIPCIHLGAAIYLWYICFVTGGHWFWSFAFPIVFVFALLNSTIAALLRYVGKGKLYLLSGVLFALSLILILIEFLSHITFGFGMFKWSLFAAAPTFLVGVFFLIAAIVKPLKNAMKRWFLI